MANFTEICSLSLSVFQKIGLILWEAAAAHNLTQFLSFALGTWLIFSAFFIIYTCFTHLKRWDKR